MQDSFSRQHPLINLIYFVLVIGFALAFSHPLAQAISLVCASAYAISISGKKSLFFLLKFCLPTVMMTAAINPLFNHKGATPLLYFSNGNPLTLESLLYGVSAGMMMVTLLMWFSSFNRVMTTDKFIFLFGKIIPALSLVLSMSLRFVPRFKTQMNAVSEAQKSIGRDVSGGKLIQRIKTAITIFSVMVSWALENAIETADSMKSRGYGLKRRTAFAIYKFNKEDKFMLVLLLLSGSVLVFGASLGAFGFDWFPMIAYNIIDMKSIIFYIVYFLLCIIPVIINLKEEIKWKISVSEM